MSNINEWMEEHQGQVNALGQLAAINQRSRQIEQQKEQAVALRAQTAVLEKQSRIEQDRVRIEQQRLDIELQRLGVWHICTSQGIDTSGDNPAGRLQLGVLMAVAEFERI